MSQELGSGRASRRGRPGGCRRLSDQVCRPVRRDGISVGEQLTGVLENDDAVAEQAPALLRMADDRPGRLTIRAAGVRALYCASKGTGRGMARCDGFRYRLL